eukprot:7145141-Alexandrium_andersonii.AAC.1
MRQPPPPQIGLVPVYGALKHEWVEGSGCCQWGSLVKVCGYAVLAKRFVWARAQDGAADGRD